MNAAAASDAFQADYCAKRLKVLSDPSRLRIIDLLRQGEMTVGDIAGFLETEIATVSHHLQILKRSQFVTPRRDGKYIYYRLATGLFQNCGREKKTLYLGCCKIDVP